MFLKRINFQFPAKYAYLHFVFEILFWSALFFVSIASIIPGNASLTISQNIFAVISNLLFGTPSHHDKISHFIAYGGLSCLGVLGNLKPFGYKRLLFVILVTWSAVIEVAQSLAFGRVGEVFDLIANTAGIAAGGLGAIVFFTVLTWLTSPQKKRA